MSNISGSRKNMSGVFDKMKELDSEKQQVTENQEAKDISPQKSKNFGDLKKLVLLGKLTESVDIDDYVFEVETLNVKQQKQLVSRLMKLDGEEKLLNIKIYTLAEAICSINSVPLEEVAMEDIEDLFNRKVEILSNFQSHIINKLYSTYEELSNKSRNAVSGGKEEIKK